MSPEGGARSHVVYVQGLLHRKQKLIPESRRSKLLMSVQVETCSRESASRWPAGHWVTCPPRLTFWHSSDGSFCPDRSRRRFKFWIAGVFCCVPWVSCCVCVVPAWSLWSGSRQWRVSLWASLSGGRRPNEMQISRFTRYGQNKTDVYIRGLDSVRILEAWGKKKKTLDVSQKVSSPTESKSV